MKHLPRRHGDTEKKLKKHSQKSKSKPQHTEDTERMRRTRRAGRDRNAKMRSKKILRGHGTNPIVCSMDRTGSNQVIKSGHQIRPGKIRVINVISGKVL